VTRLGWRVAVALVLLAASARAQTRRVGVVARAVEGAAATQADLTRAAAAALSGAEVVGDPVDQAAARRAAGAVQRERLDQLRRAQELVDEGWRAYLKVEADFADARLVAARRTLEEVLDLDGAYELLADATLRLGAVRLFARRNVEAQAAFVLAAALDPERDPGPKDFAPEVLEAYARARASRTSGVAMDVVVPGVRGAEVEIDGRPAGTAPVRVEVGVGEHVVVVRARGRVPAGRIVRAGEGPIEVTMEDDLVGNALGGGDRGLRVGSAAAAVTAILAAVATYAELDEIVLVGATWRGGAPTVLAQRCTPAPLRCGPVMETRYAAGERLDPVVAMIVEKTPGPKGRAREPILLEDTRMTEPEPPAAMANRGAGRVDEARPWWRNRWVWIGAGTAAALVGVGTWILLSDEGGGAEIVVDPCFAMACP
jgi:hypothetical protein